MGKPNSAMRATWSRVCNENVSMFLQTLRFAQYCSRLIEIIDSPRIIFMIFSKVISCLVSFYLLYFITGNLKVEVKMFSGGVNNRFKEDEGLDHLTMCTVCFGDILTPQVLEILFAGLGALLKAGMFTELVVTIEKGISLRALGLHLVRLVLSVCGYYVLVIPRTDTTNRYEYFFLGTVAQMKLTNDKS